MILEKSEYYLFSSAELPVNGCRYIRRRTMGIFIVHISGDTAGLSHQSLGGGSVNWFRSGDWIRNHNLFHCSNWRQSSACWFLILKKEVTFVTVYVHIAPGNARSYGSDRHSGLLAHCGNYVNFWRLNATHLTSVFLESCRPHWYYETQSRGRTSFCKFCPIESSHHCGFQRYQCFLTSAFLLP